MTRWLWRGYLAVSVALAGAYLTIPRSGSGRAWLFVGFSAAAVVAVLVGLRVNRPGRPLAWGMLAVGQSFNVVANVTWYLYPSLAGFVPGFPSVSDALYLVGYSTFAVGLALFLRGGEERERDRVGLLDSAIIAVGAGVVSWVFLMAPNVQNSGVSVLGRAVSVAYPLVDLLLLGLGVRLAIERRTHAPALWLLLLWLGSELTTDTIFTLTELDGSFYFGHPLFVGWLLWYAFLGATALHPSMRMLTQPGAARGSPRRGRLLILTAVALLAPGVLLVQAIGIGELDIVVAAAAAALLLVLVLGRVGALVGGLRRTEARLSLSEARLAEAQRLAQVGSWSWDMTGGEPTWSVELYRITGLDPATPSPFDALLQLTHPDDRPRLQGRRDWLSTTSASYHHRYRIVRPDGQLRVLDSKGEIAANEHGKPTRMFGTVQDITDLQRAQEQAGRLASIVEFSRDAIFAVTLDGTVITWNAGAERLFGYSAGEIVGQPQARLVPPGARDDWPPWREQLTNGGAIVDHETVRLHRDGTHEPVALTVSPIRDGSSNVTGASVIARDTAERKQLEDQLTYQALHDPLTRLANRTLLHERLVHALARAVRSGEGVALLFVDLDDFKLVNDSLGHDVGDRLLIAVADRLRACVRPADTVARLGGDEFAILLEAAGDDDAAQIAERIQAALESAVDLGQAPVRVHASIGIAHHHDGPPDAGHLLRMADMAMYAAKRQGKGGYEIFAPAMQAAVTERLELDAELRHALDIEQFRLQYQPIFELAQEEIVGFEALLRWNHSDRGPMQPDRFIPVLEESGLIVPVGQWVLRQACAQAARWQAQSQRALSISVNVSPRQLRHPDFTDHVGQALAGAGLSPSSLVLEITEGVMVTDVEQTIDKLHTLEKLGVRIAVDDFGTGYSSLSYLQTLPVNSVKIDRSFVARIQDGPQQAALAEAIVKVGQALNLTIVAEGIETAEQLDCLRRIGCQYGQGYYFAKPQDPAVIDASLAYSDA